MLLPREVFCTSLSGIDLLISQSKDGPWVCGNRDLGDVKSISLLLVLITWQMFSDWSILVLINLKKINVVQISTCFRFIDLPCKNASSFNLRENIC